MNKKILSFLLLSFSIISHGTAHAEMTGTVTNSPFFITNPFREIPKTPTQTHSGTIKPKRPLRSIDIMDNYSLVKAGTSAHLYKNKNEEIYIQKVNLASGATLIPVGRNVDWDVVTGEPLFPRLKLTDFRNMLPKAPFTMINGQFFNPKIEPTPLSFGMKIDGEVRTAGADNRGEDKNILIISTGSARIAPYSWENLRDAEGSFALVNLTTRTGHYKNEFIGRTYICLLHPDTENRSSEILIMSAMMLTESFAEAELRRFGCSTSSIAKLDSSGSSKLWYGETEAEMMFGNSHKGAPDYRRLPQVIAVME